MWCMSFPICESNYTNVKLTALPPQFVSQAVKIFFQSLESKPIQVRRRTRLGRRNSFETEIERLEYSNILALEWKTVYEPC